MRAALPHDKLTCIAVHVTMHSTGIQIVVLLCRTAAISLLGERKKIVIQEVRCTNLRLAEFCQA